MKKYNYVFYHVDLDGAGVVLLSLLYSLNKGIPCRSKCCSYGGVNNAVKSIIDNPDIQEIIIGDLSVNEEVAEQLDRLYKNGVKLRLRDHHGTALHLNKYEWAKVRETDDNGVLRSGTWWLSQDEDFLPYYREYKSLVHMIDDYDTWKWKANGDIIPNRLNALFNILGVDKFIDYVMCQPANLTAKEFFTSEANIMIDTYFRVIEGQANHLESRICTVNMWINTDPPVKLRTGVVFISGHITEIADILLNRHPELDVLMLVCYPFSVSWRTIKNLPISLASIARMFSGKGGGHPKAAGSAISKFTFSDMFTKFLDESFVGKLDFTSFELPKYT